jgi:hypothetical protein
MKNVRNRQFRAGGGSFFSFTLAWASQGRGLNVANAAERQATKILKRRWTDVERIAGSLMRRRNRKMTGRQVNALRAR